MTATARPMQPYSRRYVPPPRGGRCEERGHLDDFTNDELDHAGEAARQRAKVVCDPCPVAMECLIWALATGQEGVCGGTTTAERHRYGDALVRMLAVHRAA